jgi:hypothetical protein
VATNTEKRRGWLLERERRAALRAAAANAFVVKIEGDES